MDPTATMTRLLDALLDGDVEEAVAAGDDLCCWLDRGGFPPEGWGRSETYGACGLTAQLGIRQREVAA